MCKNTVFNAYVHTFLNPIKFLQHPFKRVTEKNKQTIQGLEKLSCREILEKFHLFSLSMKNLRYHMTGLVPAWTKVFRFWGLFNLERNSKFQKLKNKLAKYRYLGALCGG